MKSQKRRFWSAVTPLIAAATLAITSFCSVAQAASWTPVYGTNFPDPWVLRFAGHYYAYATGQGDLVGASSANGVNWTADVAPVLNTYPAWAVGGATWAPTVAYNSTIHKFVMFYSVLDKNYSPRKHCIGMATSSSPTGPFIDNSTAPFLCQPNLGGTIDPDLFIDSNGRAYLYVKNAGDAASLTDHLWVQPLTARFTATGHLTQLLTTNQAWQGHTIEGPGMVKLDNHYILFYAGNNYGTSRYAVGYATCSSPVGPCTDSPHNPVVASSGNMHGPGSPAFFTDGLGHHKMVFAAWDGPVTGFRAMYEANVALINNRIVISPIQ